MSGIPSDKNIASAPNPEREIRGQDSFLFDMEGIRTMPFFGVVPDLEKYANLPELKTAAPARRRLVLWAIKKMKKLFS